MGAARTQLGAASWRSRRRRIELAGARRGRQGVAGSPGRSSESPTARGDRGRARTAWNLRRTAAQVATLATRRAKDYRVSPEAPMPQWRARAEELGFGSRELGALLERGPVREPRIEQPELFAELRSPHGMTAQRSTFTRRDLLQILAERSDLSERVRSSRTVDRAGWTRRCDRCVQDWISYGSRREVRHDQRVDDGKRRASGESAEHAVTLGSWRGTAPRRARSARSRRGPRSRSAHE